MATGDARPTAGAYTVYDELTKELSRYLGRLESALGTGLPEINRVLSELRLEPLSIGRFDRPPLNIP